MIDLFHNENTLGKCFLVKIIQIQEVKHFPKKEGG